MKDKTKLSNDKEFLKFIKKEIREGYIPLIPIKEIDEFINEVALWYKFKYMIRYSRDKFIEKELDKNYIDLKDKMTIEQLLLRSSYRKSQVLNCDYTCTMGGNVPIYKTPEISNFKPQLSFKIYESYELYKGHEFLSFVLIKFDPITGLIYKNEFSGLYVRHNTETIEELYRYFINRNDKNIDFKELERIIKDRKINKKIREYVMKYIEINIMQYSIDVADLFKKEMNDYLKERNNQINYKKNIKKQENQLTKKKNL